MTTTRPVAIRETVIESAIPRGSARAFARAACSSAANDSSSGERAASARAARSARWDLRNGEVPVLRAASRTADRRASGESPARATRRCPVPRLRRTAVPLSSVREAETSPASFAVHDATRFRSRNASPSSPLRSIPRTRRTASSASCSRSFNAPIVGNGGNPCGAASGDVYPSPSMSLSETRLSAQAAFVARRLVADNVVKAQAVADLRRTVEAVLVADRDRERALDREVEALLRANRQSIQAAGADYSEMFRKAKKMLAARKKIPL